MICKTRHIFQLLNRIGYSNWRSANAICEIISAMPNRKKERIYFSLLLDCFAYFRKNPKHSNLSGCQRFFI